jgi:hypothetical protein
MNNPTVAQDSTADEAETFVMKQHVAVKRDIFLTQFSANISLPHE